MTINSKTVRLVNEAYEAKQELELAESKFQYHQSKLIEELSIKGLDSISVQDGSEAMTIQAKIVKATRIIFDEPKLKKLLGADKWKKVTKLVLDKTLLEDQVARGEVSTELIATCTEEKPNKPYVKFTTKKVR